LILILHTLAWGMVLFFPYLVSDAASQYKIGPLPGFYFTLSGLIHMIIFYAHALVLYPRLFNRPYSPIYLLSVVLLIFLSVTVKSYILERWFPEALPDARTHVLFPSILVFIVSVFYNIAVEKIRAETQQKENQAMQLEMELKFLRSQISPHFLFNILTNLVSLARKKSDRLESSLLMLSKLMRYMLNDSGEKIALQAEAEYLQSYLALQALRFGEDVEIKLNIDLSDNSSHTIEPMLLIPFVENAFKHGTDLVDQPLIDINLALHGEILRFEVKNKIAAKNETSKEKDSGIGLKNVRSRLALLYPARHDLVIDTNDRIFSLNLALKLL